MAHSSTRGTIITFYSWKGGTGRTMALANIAVQLARAGRATLMVDFDLEAPGLEKYFLPTPYDNRSGISLSSASREDGIIGLLNEAAQRASGKIEVEEWRARLIRVTVPVGLPSGDQPYANTPAKLHLLPSGQENQNYSELLGRFSWGNFFADQRGAEWLESIRDHWVTEYDFILIDSRTGLTDIGGVCTVHFPDLLALVFTPNSQSFEGALKIAKAAQIARASYAFERQPLMIIPMVSRWEGDKEVDLAESWMKRFDDELPEWMSSWLPLGFKPRQFIEKTRIPHVARFSFGEPLPVITHSLTDAALPGLSYDNLARLLSLGLNRCGEIIDPNYEPPVFDAEVEGDQDSKVRALVLDQIGLHKELSRLARTHGESSDELISFLRYSANTLSKMAKFAEAEPLLRRVLTLSEKRFGRDVPETAIDLNNLAMLLQDTNRLVEAEALMRRALAIDEASYGRDHPDVGIDLNNLALLLHQTNRLAEAEPLMRRSLVIGEASYGPEHPSVATRLNNLASLLQDINRLAEAEPLMLRSLAISEASYGPEHPAVATVLNNLAQSLQETNRLAEAEPLMRRALAIDEASYGPEHPSVAIRLNNLAQLLQKTNRPAEAEPLIRRSLAISEASYGPEHPDVAIRLTNLAHLLQETNRLAEAEPLMRRALAIDEVSYGPDHPDVAIDLNNLALLLQKTKRLAEAEVLMRRALAISETSYGPEHPSVATRLNNLALLLQEINRLAEAEPLMRRSLAISEASYGPEHPTVATGLNNLALLLQETNRLAEAEPLMRRALIISETSNGPEHPSVATRLNNLALLLRDTDRLAEAEPLMRRNLLILLKFKRNTGQSPKGIDVVRGNYISLLSDMGKSQEDIAATFTSLERESGLVT